MKFGDISFDGFRGREKLLKEIRRYSMYSTMFFRTNVSFHSRRMQWIAQELAPHIKKDTNLDQKKLELLCRIHDDLEIITGDHQLGRKMYTMTQEELDAMEEDEEKARKILSSVWPEEIDGYNYHALLKEAEGKNTIESQIMKIIDRLDAFGESLHETYSGNSSFLSHPELPEGVNPVQTYTKILSELPEKQPQLKHLFDGRHPLLTLPRQIDQHEIVKLAKLPTLESIKQSSGNSHYDAWKEITIKYGGEKGIRQLTTKLE